MLNEKFIHKYLRLAKQIGDDSNPCHSRHIGVVVVEPNQNRILGTGYNGPPRGTPHPDSYEYLLEVVWPQLTNGERKQLGMGVLTAEQFAAKYRDCGKCPRRLLGVASGQRLELCSCEHAEKNAIYNAAQSVHGAWMFCACGIPCWDCSKAIINAGITRVICIDHGDDKAVTDQTTIRTSTVYSPMAGWLLQHAGVTVEHRDPTSLDLLYVVDGIKE